MFDNTTPYYFGSLRKFAYGFGTLFDNVLVYRFNANGDIANTIKVPLAYAESEKWLAELKENVHAPQMLENEPAAKATRVRKTLPRMSFEMTGIQYDKGRKLQTTKGVQKPSTSNPNAFLKQLVPVPYDLSFDLNIAVKYIDDGLQILEQILCNFTPSWTLNIIDIPDLNIERDVPVIFAGITKQDTYEGSLEDERTLTWTLSFVVKGHIYPAIGSYGVIKEVIAHLSEQADMSNPVATVTVAVDPLDANQDDSHTVVTTKDEVGA
jgi:hypothetical protein